jgi:putative peptidoglycan lipid II flippase
MSLARNTAVIGGLTLVSRMLGFARDIILTAALGAGPIADAFNAALRFPNLFRRLFAEGAFSQAFVPVYSKTLKGDGEGAADAIANESLGFLLLLTGALTAGAIAAMPWINRVLFAGYADQPEIFSLAVTLTQITMPYIVAMSVASLFSGVLNARGRFFVAAAAPILLNLTILAVVIPLRDDAERAAFGAAIAVLVSGVLQASWVWIGAVRSGMRAHIGLPRFSPAVRRVLALAVPSAIAGGALQINLIVSQSLASFETGAISYLNVADRLYQLPLGLIGVAVGVAMLPRLSRLVHQGDQPGARGALDEAVALSLAFTLPAAAAILAMPYALMDGLFVRGMFSERDAMNAAAALFHYGWGVPAFVLARIYAPAFFAREDTAAPMRFALISMALNIALGAALFFGLRAMGVPGFPGLAIATSAASWVNVLLMIRSLNARGAYAPSGAALFRLVRIVAASGVLFAGLFWFTQNYGLAVDRLGSKEVAVLAAIFAAGIGYFICVFLFRAVTVRELRAAFRKERGAPTGAPPPEL